MPVRLLPPVMINRIAAGEVVERPAQRGQGAGRERARRRRRRASRSIVDGGRPAASSASPTTAAAWRREDLALAVERHATSKLAAEADLARHPHRSASAARRCRRSARWRACRSHRRARERRRGPSRSPSRAGAKPSRAPAALAAGTRVEVRDLFFATPARLKFLKSERAESAAIADVVKRLAMAHPDVALHPRRPTSATRLDLCRRDARGRAGRLARLGAGRSAPRLPRQRACRSTAEREGVRLAGFAGLPTSAAATAGQQYLFVNGRPVRDKLLIGALRAAYADLVPRDRHPAGGALRRARPARGRRQRPPGQGRGALPRPRPGARR